MWVEESQLSTEEIPVSSEKSSDLARRRLRVGLTLLLAAAALAAVFFNVWASGAGLLYLYQQAQTFVTIFLGIFVEAVPFLLAGSLVSGLIAVFVDQSAIDRYLPKRALPGALVGAALGVVFPVCECGVVPVVRRLYEKGLPLSIGVAFLLAAPVVNPIVILSTYSAFGWGSIFVGRVLFSFLIAVVVALLFSRARPDELLRPVVFRAHHDACCNAHSHSPPAHSARDPLSGVALLEQRLTRSFNLAGDDFLEMARFLVVGSLLAAAMQTVVPQSMLLSVGQGPVVSVLVMQALAFILSVCSTVDAFLALAFLVFGPMVDIKSSLMFLSIFPRRAVAYLILLPLMLALLMGIGWNLNLGW